MTAHHITRREQGNVSIVSGTMCNRTRANTVFPPAFRPAAVLLALSLLSSGCAAPQPAAYFPAGTGRLTVQLEGFRNDRGAAIVSLFAGAKGFPDDVTASVATVSAAIGSAHAVAVFTDLPYGEYAVSVLHDEDGDGRMATGLLGDPREGFGFSGYPDYRFGHPDYATVKFLLVEPLREMTVVVRYQTGRRQHQEEGRAAESRRPRE